MPNSTRSRKYSTKRRSTSVRRAKPVTGYGAYKGGKGWVPGLGKFLGRAAGSYFGMGDAGAAIGDRLGRWSGLGAYKCRRNTIVSPSPPVVSNSGEGGIRVRHREYIGDVTGSTGFVNAMQLPLNPGLASSFPWLSSVANNFTQYRWHGIIFEYVTSSGNSVAATSTALGEVILATNYNVLDTPFPNKQAALNEEFSVNTVPSKNIIHPIECAPSMSTLDKLYVRSGAAPANSDLKMYDLGLFQLMTQGMPSVYTTGEIWASYDVELMKPSLQGGVGDGGDASSTHISIGGITAANPLGTTVTHSNSFDNIGVTAQGTTVTIAAGATGKYVLSCSYLWVTGSNSQSPTIASASNATPFTMFYGESLAAVNAGYNTAGNSTACSVQYAFTVQQSTLPTVITLGTNGVFGSGALCDLLLTQINYSDNV